MPCVPVKVSDDSGFAEGYSAEIHQQVSIMLNNKKVGVVFSLAYFPLTLRTILLAVVQSFDTD